MQMSVSHIILDTSLFNSGVSITVSALVVGFVGALGFLVRPRFKEKRAQESEKRAFINQCFDHIRHFMYSSDALGEILRQRECDDQRPSELFFSYSHLQKLCFLPKSMSFSHELYKVVPFEIVGEMQHMKLRLRNLTVDIEEAKRVYREGTCCDVYKEVSFLIGQFKNATLKTKITLGKLGVHSMEINRRVGKYENEKPSGRNVRFFPREKCLSERGSKSGNG